MKFNIISFIRELQMPTINQLIRHGRIRPTNKTKVPAMQSCPQKRGVCTRVYTTTPKNLIQRLEKLQGLG